MFTDQITQAISTASLTGCDDLAVDLWRAYAAGAIPDPAAETLSTALEARRRALRGQAVHTCPEIKAALSAFPSCFKPRRVQISPDRARSLQRRRRNVASGLLPPAIACRFTYGEQSVLIVVARAIQERGLCDLYVEKIAALAGVCRRTAQTALRHAAKLGLLSIEERRQRGRPNDTNIVRLISREWITWLRIGCKRVRPSQDKFEKGLVKRVGEASGSAQKQAFQYPWRYPQKKEIGRT